MVDARFVRKGRVEVAGVVRGRRGRCRPRWVEAARVSVEDSCGAISCEGEMARGVVAEKVDTSADRRSGEEDE